MIHKAMVIEHHSKQTIYQYEIRVPDHTSDAEIQRLIRFQQKYSTVTSIKNEVNGDRN